MTHVIDKVCFCECCTMLDIMFGDPLLTKWEKRFIRDVAEKGWLFDYTERQVAKIKEIFWRQKQKYKTYT